MEPVEIIRNFRGSDVFMTQTARVIHGLFFSDLSAFTAFDATMDGPYAAAFLAEVEAAETVVADTAVIDQQVIMTEEVQAAMDEGRKKYTEVKYFVQKSFSSSPGTQNEFGLNDYEKARKSSAQMVQFLFEMHAACNKYGATLIDNGYSQLKIDEILTLRDDLLAKNYSQKLFKKQRPKLTEDRIIVLSACYNTMMNVMAAAQIVYQDDYAKQQQFVYQPSANTDDTREFTGTIAPAGIATISTLEEYNPETVVSFRNTGVASLTFSLSKTGAVEPVTVELDGGATVSKLLSELQADATNILVRNNDLAQQGSYTVEVAF